MESCEVWLQLLWLLFLLGVRMVGKGLGVVGGLGIAHVKMQGLSCDRAKV